MRTEKARSVPKLLWNQIASARELQPMQGLAVRPTGLVGGNVPRPAELMKDLPDLQCQRASRIQGTDQLDLALLRGDEQAEVSGRTLCQHLRELPELHQAGGGVLREVALRLCPQGYEERIMGSQELEVRGAGLRVRHAAILLRAALIPSLAPRHSAAAG